MKALLVVLFTVISSVCFAQQTTEQEKLKQIDAQQQLLKDGKITYDDYLKNVEAIRAEKVVSRSTNDIEQSKKIIEETNESAKKKAAADASKAKNDDKVDKSGADATKKQAEEDATKAQSELTRAQAEAQIKEATRIQEEAEARKKQEEADKRAAEQAAKISSQEKENNKANRIRPGDELLKFSKQFYTGMGLFIAGEGVGTLGLLIAGTVAQSTAGASIGAVGPMLMLGGAILATVGVVNLTTSFLHIRNAGKMMNQKQDILSK